MNNEIEKLKSRSFLSIGSLLIQSSYSALLGFFAFFILTLKSGVYLLGIYNTVLALINFFNYFTNLGLAAAIVQKKEINEEDLNTAFYIQFFLTLGAVVIGFYLTRYLFKFYKDLPQLSIYLYWSLLLSFFLSSLKTIPSTLLEKKIEIYKNVFVQATENTIFYLSVIIFSLLNFDIFSLVFAVIFRSIIGLILIYLLNPWLPKLTFSLKSAKSLLRFGIPFQSNSFLALIKDDFLIIYLGGAIGMKNLGYVTFAKKYAEFSIRLIMDNINRVAFPLFSKFQHHKKLLKKSLEKVLFYESLFIFPIIIGSLFIFDSALKIFPNYYQKWYLSLFSFYFFSFSALFISLYSPLINLFNAIGQVKLSLFFMIFFTLLTWTVIPLMIKSLGYNGISIAFFLMSLSFIFVILVAKKEVNFSFLKTIKPVLLSTFIMASCLLFLRIIFLNWLKNIYLHLFFSFFCASFIYLLFILKLSKKSFYIELIKLFKNV